MGHPVRAVAECPRRGTGSRHAASGGVLAEFAGLQRLLATLFAAPEYFVDGGVLLKVVYAIGPLLGLPWR